MVTISSKIDALVGRTQYHGVSASSSQSKGIYMKSSYASTNYRCQLSVRKCVLYLGSHKDPRVLAVLSDFARQELAPWITEKARGERNYPHFDAYEELPQAFRDVIAEIKKNLSETRFQELEEYNRQAQLSGLDQELGDQNGSETCTSLTSRGLSFREQIASALGGLYGVHQQSLLKYREALTIISELQEKNKFLTEQVDSSRKENARLLQEMDQFKATAARNAGKKFAFRRVPKPGDPDYVPSPVVDYPRPEKYVGPNDPGYVPPTPDVGSPLPAEETPAALDTPPASE
jgi:hypothetical protein